MAVKGGVAGSLGSWQTVSNDQHDDAKSIELCLNNNHHTQSILETT